MKLKIKLATAIIVVFTLVISYSCKKAKTIVDQTICNGTPPTYVANVKAILDANCTTAGCHNATDKAHDMDLTTYTLAKAESGEAHFLHSIKHEVGLTPMPYNRPKLSDADIKTIECWIKNGALQQ